MTGTHVGTPTRTGTAIAVAVTLATVGVLAWYVDFVAIPTVVGAVGAAGLAASLRVLEYDGRGAMATLVTGLLTVPVGAALLGATALTTLRATATVFPVDEAALVSVGTLVVVGYAGVATGCVLAVSGLALGVRNVVTPAGLAAYTRVGVFAGVAPALVAGVLVLVPVAFGEAGTPLVRAGLSTVADPLLAPTPPQLHLATFALAAALAAVGLRVALAALPVGELLADTGLGQTSERRVRRAGRALAGAAVVAGTAAVVAGLVERQLSPARLAGLLGPVYRPVQAVTTAGSLRLGLVGVAGLAFAAAAASVGLRRLARQPGDTLRERVVPLVGGSFVTVCVLGLAGPLYRRGTAGTADRLPAALAEEFRRTAADIADVFGEGALLVVLTTILVTAPLSVVLAVRGLRRLGYLSTATAGYSVASAGLFVATVFAGTLDAPVALVFGGIIASITVRDAGRFGTTVGREVGRAAGTRTVELVHTGGTVLVGVVGVGAAVGVGRVIPATGGGAATPATVTALFAVVAGLFLLVAALR